MTADYLSGRCVYIPGPSAEVRRACRRLLFVTPSDLPDDLVRMADLRTSAADCREAIRAAQHDWPTPR